MTQLADGPRLAPMNPVICYEFILFNVIYLISTLVADIHIFRPKVSIMKEMVANTKKQLWLFYGSGLHVLRNYVLSKPMLKSHLDIMLMWITYMQNNSYSTFHIWRNTFGKYFLILVFRYFIQE